MGLKNLVLPTETIKIPGDEKIVVRGLSLNDVTAILLGHREVLDKVFAKIGSKKPADPEFVGEMIGILLREAPAAAAAAIAFAADEPEHIEIAAKLPVDVQVAALEGIARLTFAMEGGLGKFVETVGQYIGALYAEPQSSTTGSMG